MPTPPAISPDQLPSVRTLRRSAGIAVLVAVFLGLTVVLPAERGVDPTGLGRVFGLTVMGKFKMEAKREFAAAAERLKRDSATAAAARADSARRPR
jgi:hypothetical protein